MFTLQEIQEAHQKVKSGKDFPQFVQDLKELGVKIYETYVIDGHTEYFTKDSNRLSSLPKYDPLEISDQCQPNKFREILRFHQNGNSDYFTFCKEAAEAGIDKWMVDVEKMVCVYFDKNQTLIYEEEIPK
jgi:uncharacterized protein YbcV (DUF1398 family)